MIDSQNLRTASLYINNQLLSRGLLRDGQNIDFANPEAGKGDVGLESTMGQIISVVNDLILRRDVCPYTAFLSFSLLRVSIFLETRTFSFPEQSIKDIASSDLL